jgi:GH24 family phage-related lysozyme (muramidase)
MTFFQTIASWFKPPAPKPPAAAHGTVSGLSPALVGPKALDLILEMEGMDQPWLRPPGESGITIGVGFDLGYCTPLEFDTAWRRHLSPEDYQRLAAVIGKKGNAAEAVKSSLRTVKPITSAAAKEVFYRCTLPKWTMQTARAFPGLHVLTPDQQGVLVSLVFNRGPSLGGGRRVEMAQIARVLQTTATPKSKARQISALLRSMKRLWPTIPGLRRRREEEAKLMELET